MRGANVLLVTIDTLRKDRVGAYGNARGLTPTLDRLTARGVRYTNAFSHAPMTLPAHTSIMTGLTPRRHGVRNNTNFRLDDHIPTLAALLKQAGYRTGAFVGAFVLDGRFGLSRGFDDYDDRLPHQRAASFHFGERRAGEVVAAAGNWILQTSSVDEQRPADPRQPWFAWVHLFDPHAPYDPPVEYRGAFSPYDGEVAYADAMLGRLLTRLESAGQMDRTLVVVTADHGESLGEHGETTHGLFAYDATIRVPLIVTAKAVRAGIVDAPVAHMDLAPTILDLVGAAVPERFDGQSLARPFSPDRPLYFEALDANLTRSWAPLRGVVQSGWKYIDLPDAELYDLTQDPAEDRNRFGHDPHGDTLARALRDIEAVPEAAAPMATLDAEAAARLRSLGYVGGPSGSRGRTFASADDPKRLVGLNERFNAALTAFDERRPDEALAAFRSILLERPDFVPARTSAATALVAVGRRGEAVQLLRAAPRDQLESPELLAKLGTALRDSGDLGGAVAAFERARAGGDRNPELLDNLAVAYAALGRSADARALFLELVARPPTAATTWYNYGLFELQSGAPAAAAEAFRHAVQREPGYGEAWQALGAALVKVDLPAAIEAWRQAERLVPGDYDLLFNLAMLAAQSDKPADALPYLRRFAREAPRDRYARDIERVERTIASLLKDTSARQHD